MSDLIERQTALDAIYACHVDGKRIKRLSKSECLPDSFTSGILEAISAVEEVPVVSQWIPCIERMPEGEQMVIACTEEGFIVISLYTDENLFEDVRETVVAWMPLPIPYESPEDE